MEASLFLDLFFCNGLLVRKKKKCVSPSMNMMRFSETKLKLGYDKKKKGEIVLAFFLLQG